MKVYRVVHLDGTWYMSSPSAIEEHHWQRLVFTDDDKDSLLRLACVLARKWQGEVQVFDGCGRLSEKYRYGFRRELVSP